MPSHQTLAKKTIVREFRVASFVNRLLAYFDKVLPHLGVDFAAVDLDPLRRRVVCLLNEEIHRDPEEFDREMVRAKELLRGAFSDISEREARIDVASLRQLVSRLGKHDQKILIALLSFYRLQEGLCEWTDDHTDKVDFLLSCLGQSVSLVELGEHLRSIRDLRSSETKEMESVAIEQAASEIRAFRDRSKQIGNLQDLHSEGGLVAYRRLKHDLGSTLFEPNISMLVVGTNAEFKAIVDPLLKDAEQKLREEFEAVTSELDGNDRPDTDLQMEMLKGEVAKLESANEAAGLKVKVLAEVRDQVQLLARRLTKKERVADAQDLNCLADLRTENELLREAVSELTLESLRLKRALQEAQAIAPPVLLMAQLAS